MAATWQSPANPLLKIMRIMLYTSPGMEAQVVEVHATLGDGQQDACIAQVVQGYTKRQN